MSKYIVFNGSRVGLFKFANFNLLGNTKYKYIYDIPETELSRLKYNYPGTKSFYLYDPSDLVGKTIHDIGPTYRLYDTFVNVSGSKN